MEGPLPLTDLDHILRSTDDLWEEMRGAHLFVTGGTGFFGRWMLESFLQANDRLGLRARATVLTRSPSSFASSAPHVTEHPALRLHEGDVRSFIYPEGECTHILHMATETDLDRGPTASRDTASEGTARVLGYAGQAGVDRLLLTSSGAIYGPQPADVELLPEEYRPTTDTHITDYGMGKRCAEALCQQAARETGLKVKIARCFAFVGPLLPLDMNFAIGNFIRDALYGDHIRVRGDGTPRRSYLYAADLAVWLWTVLFKGQSSRPYNVGSEQHLSISELASLVASVLNPSLPVLVAEHAPPGQETARYVPSTERATQELHLTSHYSLDDAILRTANWHSAHNDLIG